MSTQHPYLVYVGDLDVGRRLYRAVRPLGWHVYLPADTFEALGIVALYAPDAVILDFTTRPVVSSEVYFHLRTLTSGCPSIVAVTRDAETAGWTDPQRYVLPPTSEPARMIAAARTVVERDESIWE